MRWRNSRRSHNIDDQRHHRTSLTTAGGGLTRLLPMVFRFLGFKGTAILVLAVGVYGLMTGNLGAILGVFGLQQGPSVSESELPLQQTESEKELADFVSVILADTETTWSQIFKQHGQTYQQPQLVLFRHSVKSACGMAQAAIGPFYCPTDQKVYIDLGFYEQLKNQFNAPGDFAQAYVIAHEVGHHIQTLKGTSAKIHATRNHLNTIEGNKLSVLQELQADCFAGVWAYHANASRQLLEAGDIEEGLTAASAIGDDTLQKQAQGYVNPDSFTHGTAAQRVKWFKIGLKSGDMTHCDTFSPQ